MQHDIRERVHGILPVLVVVMAATLIATRPALAESGLVNNTQPITGGIEVHLIFTDAEGKQQDYSLATAPPTLLSKLTPRLQAESKLPLLQPGFFLGDWSLAAESVCQDVVALVKQDINSKDNQAYSISCKPMKVGLLHAQIQTEWENSSLFTVKGRRLVLTYYVPPYSRVPFWLTSPVTCHKGGSNMFCASDPKYTLLYDVALQLIATSSDPNSFKLPLTSVSDSGITMQALLNGAGWDKQIDAAVARFEEHLAVDAGMAVVNWYGALISAVVQAVKLLITNSGALVAEAADAHLRDEVSSKLSLLYSGSAGQAATRASDAFNLLFAALESANVLGFTELDVDVGPNHSLQFRLIYPPPIKPQLSNAAVAGKKLPHLVPPSIGTGVQNVKPGFPFLVHGDNFHGSYTNALDISWNKTVAGQVAKTQIQWGAKGGPMQTSDTATIESYVASVDGGSFRPDNLQPGTTYQFRVQECDSITCSPWSDWLFANTQRGGSDAVAVWLDSDSGHPIGNGVILSNGSFEIKAMIPAGASQGTHTLHAALGPLKSRAGDDQQQASVGIMVCGPQGCGPAISVIDSQTRTAIKPPINLLYPSTIVVRGDHFVPGVIVTLYLNSATGPKLGSATPNKLGIFEAGFQIPYTQTGNHHLVAVQSGKGQSMQAREEVVLSSQPK